MTLTGYFSLLAVAFKNSNNRPAGCDSARSTGAHDATNRLAQTSDKGRTVSRSLPAQRSSRPHRRAHALLH
ncbi:MAG: hypothetical protein B7X65_14465 [Polaromonas sp. 39-63-25]|jgi:hypothetical protein|nr:MAG: hypothetical protein B7Y60_07675 [Polaromonas sp. 35-63-35]OYZ21550.1 MAG: hypothetical protein B7Y28_04750 [Polaromonas sp. 16-63-31]OYZ77692.1 MAG: hypothetical protein B7Y09_15325 [Polaromonas sp. 24-63-21]OZA49979.1 MAG: hypothetical protein B7X88_12725 [Polaromonas sp. 17-63-33]OZA87029.1 MAG: hypothetical protein B7X65_14465 [Polaromonas sp. 39-63-25]